MWSVEFENSAVEKKVAALIKAKKLTADNYCDGPKADTYNQNMPDYYEFGVMVKGHEIYIKINIGLPNKPIDCMSFHLAEFPITYPLKK